MPASEVNLENATSSNNNPATDGKMISGLHESARARFP